jgi:hypothetical protein
MFEIGKPYSFTLLQDGGDTTYTDEVTAVVMPLIKLKRSIGDEFILNTHSSSSVSAVLHERPVEAIGYVVELDDRLPCLDLIPQRPDI